MSEFAQALHKGKEALEGGELQWRHLKRSERSIEAWVYANAKPKIRWGYSLPRFSENIM